MTSVVVCRPAAQSGSLSDGLARRGFEIVHVPLIEVVSPLDAAPLREAVGQLDRYRWVAFTSTNAVQAVADVLADRDWPPTTHIAVVGTATGRAVVGQGWTIELCPDRSTAEELAAALPAARSGERLLAPLAELAGDDLVDGAQHAGFAVDRVTAYRTITPPVPAELAARARQSDAVLFTSPSIVERWALAVHPSIGDGGPAVICIGPSTAGAAERSGFVVAAVADPHDADGLIDAVVNTLDP